MKLQQTKQGQYVLTIPKKVVESIGLSKGKELKFELGNRKFIFHF